MATNRQTPTLAGEQFYLVNGPAASGGPIKTWPRRQAPNQVYVPREGWRGEHVFEIGVTAFKTAAEARAQSERNYGAMTSAEFEAWHVEQDRLTNERQASRREAMARELETA